MTRRARLGALAERVSLLAAQAEDTGRPHPGLVRVWRDGRVTTEGRTHASSLPGAYFRLARSTDEVVQTTRRDAFVIRDAMIAALGWSGFRRRCNLMLAGESSPSDRLSFPEVPESPGVASAVRRLRDFARDSSSWPPALARAVDRLLLAHEVGAGVGSSCRDLLQAYADGCGATYGDPEVGAAIDVVLSEVQLEGRVLGAVSTTEDVTPSGAVVIDLGVIVDACVEAIGHRQLDGSVPRVTVSADVLLAVASYAHDLQEAATRLSSGMGDHGGLAGHATGVVGVDVGRLFDVAILASQGAVVGGSGAADAEGEAVYPAVGHPLDRSATSPVRADAPPSQADPYATRSCYSVRALANRLSEVAAGLGDAAERIPVSLQSDPHISGAPLGQPVERPELYVVAVQNDGSMLVRPDAGVDSVDR
jgi:hypothetical protein